MCEFALIFIASCVFCFTIVHLFYFKIFLLRRTLIFTPDKICLLVLQIYTDEDDDIEDEYSDDEQFHNHGHSHSHHGHSHSNHGHSHHCHSHAAPMPRSNVASSKAMKKADEWAKERMKSGKIIH